MSAAEELARKSFEEDLAKDQSSRPPLDHSWIGLRLYIHQDDGLWLFHDGRSYHPLFMAFKIDAAQVCLTEATGLVRAAHGGDRILKRFQLDKLPYNLTDTLTSTMKDALGSELKVMNETSRNFDPVYRAVILFTEIEADKSRQYTIEKGHLKWFALPDIAQAEEQDGVIIGMDSFHLQELTKLAP